MLNGRDAFPSRGTTATRYTSTASLQSLQHCSDGRNFLYQSTIPTGASNFTRQSTCNTIPIVSLTLMLQITTLVYFYPCSDRRSRPITLARPEAQLRFFPTNNSRATSLGSLMRSLESGHPSINTLLILDPLVLLCRLNLFPQQWATGAHPSGVLALPSSSSHGSPSACGSG
jgi:hypothetical protein